jgi:alpha-galactosidase
LKIAFVGAGSVVVTKNLLTDTFSFPELRGATVALHNIDAMVDELIDAHGDAMPEGIRTAEVGRPRA